jgi:DNA-binding PadR family transcriptional regulator
MVRVLLNLAYFAPEQLKSKVYEGYLIKFSSDDADNGLYKLTEGGQEAREQAQEKIDNLEKTKKKDLWTSMKTKKIE